MTLYEAEKSGMDDWEIATGIVTGDIDVPELEGEYIHPVHGRIVETRFDPWHDVTVYEDGHEERFYIGE